jgi:outer membrane receptor protein involved in Fe transport
VLYTLTREKVRTGEASPDRDKLSPTVSASYKLLDDKEFRLRAFYKNIFRVPTFNELYYVSLGNHNLRPENANQIDIGFKYLETTIPFISELECSIDGYFNRVTDKIIAIPQDLFHWSMTNKGLVDIKGFDANMKVVTPVIKSDELIFRFTYNYNEATDLTSGSANYGEQIPYTPYYSGSGSASYHHGMWEGGYNLFFSGKQWIGQNISANRIDAYSVHSLFATSYFRNWKLTGEIINIFNTQYEVYKFYPMPRRNFRITVSKDI